MKDVLIIDDEQVILDAVATVARSEGWSVETAIDAVSAMVRLDANSYRVIVCDILMPQMDGFDLLREVQKRWVATPVVMTTGYSTMENAVKSLYCGAVDFVAKPFTAEEIIAAVRRAVRYGQLLERGRDDNGVPAFVPCPSRYQRLGYTSWLHHERDGTVRIGVTDLMLRIVEPLAGVELAAAGEELVQGSACAHVTAEDGVRHAVLSPVGGRILDVHSDIAGDVRIVLKDPYFEGWFYRLIPADLEYDARYLTPCASDRDVKTTILRKG
jgi:CheY-like chemotaxis protein/glycine cleavage system H lipoate-binding protein